MNVLDILQTVGICISTIALVAITLTSMSLSQRTLITLPFNLDDDDEDWEEITDQTPKKKSSKRRR